jgi:hypothetical protein
MNSSELEVQAVDKDIWRIDMDVFNVGLFNTWQWVSSLTNGFTTDVYLHFSRNGEVIGKMAGFMLNQGRLKGKHLYFSSGPGLKKWESDTFRDCLTALHHYSLKEGYARVHVRPFEQEIHDVLDLPDYFHTVAKEYVVFYSDFTERVKYSFGFKQNAKKARKAGAVFKSTRSLEILDRLFELMDNTRITRKAKYGHNYDPMYLLNLNKETLTKLLNTGMGIMHYAEIDGVVHSVQFNIEHDGKIFALLMGSDDVAYGKGIPSFIDQNISNKAFEDKARYYNLGTVPLESEGGVGLQRYKESQGSREILRFGYYTYFLTFPYKLLNPFIRLSKNLPDNPVINMGRRAIRLFNFS